MIIAPSFKEYVLWDLREFLTEYVTPLHKVYQCTLK